MGACLTSVAEVISEENAPAANNQPHVANNQVPAANNEPIVVNHQAPVVEHKFNIQDVNPETVKNVPFKDEIIDMKIVKVYDGDTIHIIAAFGNLPVKLAIRMLGIDTPEVKAGKDKLKEEKIAALICKKFLADLVKDGAKVIIRDWDKFGGRVLGDVILPDGKKATDVLIEKGYGRPYFGDEKKKWTLQELTSAPYDVQPRDLDINEADQIDDYLSN